jgi:hypothetical protein
MSDPYAYWNAALAGEKPEIHADHPQAGIYKTRRSKNGPLFPVIIWLNKDNVLNAMFGKELVDPLKVWTYCADKPVSREDYAHFKEHGRFPGEIASIGDNSGDLSLAAEIADKVDRAGEWLASLPKGITSQVEADTTANMRTQLLELKKKAEDEKEEKYRPHKKAADAVVAEYNPLIDTAEGTQLTLRRALTAWGNLEAARLKAEQEAKHKAEAASRTAEMPPLAPPPPPKIQMGGQVGRKTGMRTVVRFEIDDYDVLCAEFCQHESVRAEVLRLATQRAKTGVVVPGLKRTETQEAA